jgi:predicted amidophosphoribosyltransferase
MSLSELQFGSFLSYSPRGASKSAGESRDWMARLKGDLLYGNPRQPTTRWIATRLKDRLRESALGTFFEVPSVLVPIPSSSKQQAGTPWVPLNLAKELHRHGLGQEVWPCLIRTTVVRKSSTAPPDERPRAREHFESMTLNRELLDDPEGILLVDDVVTRGATLLGAAQRLQEAFPNASVRAFAAMRTIRDPDEFDAIHAPAVGWITLRGEDSFRRP